MEQTRGLFYTCDSGVPRCQSLLANEFVVRSVVRGKMSLAAANQNVNNEAMNGWTNLKTHCYMYIPYECLL